MSSLPALLHIWKLSAATLLLSFVAVGFIAWWLGWGWAIALSLLSIWVQLEWWGEIKTKLLAILPEEMNYNQMPIDALPNSWDVETLNNDTQTLKELGFQHINDIRLADDCNNGVLTFSRLFGHPQHFCFAELILAETPEQTPLPRMCSIHSKLALGWSLSSSRTQLSGLSYMWRNDQELWVYHPDAELPDLLDAHLQRRNILVDVLNCPVVQDISWDMYEHQTSESSGQRREIFRRKNIVWALWEATWFELAQPTEWMGSAAKLLEKSGNSNPASV